MGTNLGIPLPAPWASTGVVLLTEFILTYLLMTSIFGTAVDDRGRAVKIGGFGIGLTVAFDILAGGAVSGASMNPARSFGPALEMMHRERGARLLAESHEQLTRMVEAYESEVSEQNRTRRPQFSISTGSSLKSIAVQPTISEVLNDIYQEEPEAS